MSLKKWLSVFTFLLIVAANVLGFMTDSGMNIARTHATVGLLAALSGLVLMVIVLRNKSA